MVALSSTVHHLPIIQITTKSNGIGSFKQGLGVGQQQGDPYTLSSPSSLLLRNHPISHRRHRRHRSVPNTVASLTPGDDSSQFIRNKSSNTHPRPSSDIVAVCDALDDFINTTVGIPPSVVDLDPNYSLVGNFAPVGELGPLPCPAVWGSIPPCLRGGAYVRNGPNPQFVPQGPHHNFDGNGMLHSILLPPGGGSAPAVYCSRYVKTYRYCVERDLGRQVFPKPFSGFSGLAGVARGAIMGGRMLAGQINPLKEGLGLGNTSVAYIGNQLLALEESDLPYAVHLSLDGDITTVGRCNFDGKLLSSMTAHPKKDPETGEVFAYRCSPFPPYITYFWFDGNGNMQPEVPFSSLKQATLRHDFAITKRYAIFPDGLMAIKPMDMVLNGESIIGIDSGKIPRLGVIPRYATSEKEMRWFEVPGFNVLHVINAWDEDEDTIVLVATNMLSVENMLQNSSLLHNCVEMVRIDLRNGIVTRKPLSAGRFDFGVINPRYVGRKSRYAYVASIENDPVPIFSGVAKMDLSGREIDHVVAMRKFPKGCFGGEPFFVSDGDEEEDGYVVMIMRDSNKDRSSFIVMNASSPDLEIVAEVSLPQRVPNGFHGLFVSRAEIVGQKMSGRQLWPPHSHVKENPSLNH